MHLVGCWPRSAIFGRTKFPGGHDAKTRRYRVVLKARSVVARPVHMASFSIGCVAGCIRIMADGESQLRSHSLLPPGPDHDRKREASEGRLDLSHEARAASGQWN